MTQVRFKPDFAPPPGELLGEYLEVLGISIRELARRCGRSAKLISEIVGGTATVEPEKALQFGRVIDLEASIWLKLEAEHRLLNACKQEDERLGAFIAWARAFPLTDLYKEQILPRPKTGAQAVRDLLKFFGVASV